MIYVLLGFLVFWLATIFLARSGHGGTLGEKIRASDWQCWRDAVQEKEEELEQLRKVEPRI